MQPAAQLAARSAAAGPPHDRVRPQRPLLWLPHDLYNIEAWLSLLLIVELLKGHVQRSVQRVQTAVSRIRVPRTPAHNDRLHKSQVARLCHVCIHFRKEPTVARALRVTKHGIRRRGERRDADASDIKYISSTHTRVQRTLFTPPARSRKVPPWNSSHNTALARAVNRTKLNLQTRSTRSWPILSLPMGRRRDDSILTT